MNSSTPRNKPHHKPRYKKAQANDTRLLRHYIKRQVAVVAKRSKLILSREHSEDVHQMRVATRRLRAALYAMGKDKSKIAKDLRWLTRRLGTVRDLDVQMEQLGHTDVDRRYQRYLESHWTPARRRLTRAIKTKRMQLLLRKLEALPYCLGKSAGSDLRSAICAELQHIKRSGRRIRSDSPFERLHRLRIHCKRLRYQIEILQPAKDTPLHAVLRELKKTLEVLGELQDTRVAVAHLLEYEDTLGPTKVDHKNLERKLAKQERRAEKIRQTFPAAWQRLEKKLLRSLVELTPPGH